MNLSFKQRGIKELEDRLKKIPYGYKRIALAAFSDYTIGNSSHGLKWYPAPQGQKYVRTYTLRNGWYVKDTNGGYRPVITNAVPYAPYVPKRWAHYGWREYAEIIKSNFKGAIRHAQAQVSAWIKAGAK